MKYLTYFSVLTVAIYAFSLVGCSSAPWEPVSTDAHGDHDHDEGDDHDHSDHDHGNEPSGLTDMEKMKAELAKLSPEDATSAEKQHMCLVSGEMLGTMGAPIKMDVNGQQVWICCKGCKKALLDDPDKYLAKLPK